MVNPTLALQSRSLGLPDDAFEQRRPLRGQITKREVRAVSLYRLGLKKDSVVWDIGAGTGSVSIEASLVAHRGRVYAIERDESSLDLLRNNVANLSGGNVHIVTGEAPEALADLPDPDSVFVGGSGGRLGSILEAVIRRLKTGGRVVVNLAALERTQDVYHRLKDEGLSVDLTTISASRGREMPDGAVRLEAMNPVFIVTGETGPELPTSQEP